MDFLVYMDGHPESTVVLFPCLLTMQSLKNGTMGITDCLFIYMIVCFLVCFLAPQSEAKGGSVVYHQQDEFWLRGASGSVWELSDQNPRVVWSQTLLDRFSRLQMHLGAPGSSNHKLGSTSNRHKVVWKKHSLLWERCWCTWKSWLLFIVQCF